MAMHFAAEAVVLDTGSVCNEPSHSKLASCRHQLEQLRLPGKQKSLCWKGIAACQRSSSDGVGNLNQDGGPEEFHTLSWAQGIRPKRNNVSTSAAVSTAARLAFDEEEVKPWRLEDKLRELKILRDALNHAKPLDQKLQILNNSPRVRAVFGNLGKVGLSSKPIIASALETMGDGDIYLLKCLVAGGQEHVLDVAPAWFEHLEKLLEKETLFLQNAPQTSDKNMLRQASAKLLNLIGGIDVVKLQHTKVSDKELPPHLIPDSNGVIVKELGSMGNGSTRDGHAKPRDFCEELRRQIFCSILERLIKILSEMETFYDSIGGIIGYQAAALQLIKDSESEQHFSHFRQRPRFSSIEGPTSKRFFVPVGPDLSQDKEYGAQAAIWGLEALPAMGEIYPLGGAGDRLGLVDETTGECLPVAMLPYCGRTLLEGLIRDLQAREYLHFKVFGQQHITPVAIMTSAAKKNNERVMGLCESHGWFGRSKSNFCLFEQPLVPAVGAEDGRWLTNEPLLPILKPGGHGVIWKLACDKGVFDWFYRKGRKAAIVRQISNPIAATDVTLLALAGVGHRHNKKFGFASCERNVGAAEGVNVLVERSTTDGWEYCVTCIEYTEFSKLGIPDVPVSPGSMQAQYPANTNVLYVDLPSVEHVASAQSSASLPGMILNLKKPIVFEDHLGVTHSTYAGRIECTMQNAADSLVNKTQSRLCSAEYENLDTFLIYNQRRKVTSSAKRKRKASDFSLHQTPDGSFFDITWNAHDLLSSCMVDVPEMESKECYIESGPPFIVLLHPAIGPIWDVVRQKICGGSINKGSELQLEISEICWQNVQLDGSLLILAENVVGSFKRCENGENILSYGEGCGRCRLERVRISNQGVDWSCKENVYWQHKVHRLETLKIILHGNSEFEAYDVVLEGSHTFEVPDGYRMRVTKGSSGVSCVLDPLPADSGTWCWNYTLQDGQYVHLKMES